MSTYACPVVTLKREEILKNPDSDHLYYLTVPNTGYVCVIRGKDWINEDGTLKHKKAAYCAPQTIAPANLPQFEFLKEKDTDTKVRIKARKLRNINSFGLLVPVPDDTPEGTDMWATWGLEHYEPVVEPGGDNANVSVPSLKDFTKYDVENIKNYMSAFVEGEPCIAMLKCNGQNMRVRAKDGEVYVGSRSYWKANNETSDFWRSYRSVSALEKFVKENEHLCIFGESYGNLPKFREDCPAGERRFRAFDIFNSDTNSWLQYPEFLMTCKHYDIPFCPIIYEGPFDFEKLKELAENDSPLKKGQMMEGLVIWPANCDYHKRLGRRKAKLVSLRYEEKS